MRLNPPLAPIVAVLAAAPLGLLACRDDPFFPLVRACVGEMGTAQATYGTPTAQHRETLGDGRLAIIWDLPSEPGGFRHQIAFVWNPASPRTCDVCLPLDPCWPSS